MIVALVFGLALNMGCAKKAVKSGPEETATPSEGTEGIPAEEQPAAVDEAAAALEAERAAFLSENVLFAFDSAVLDETAQGVLRRKAEWLQKGQDAVVIEGHCDERGSNEYNLALGDRRANAAKKFLVDLGIDAARLETVSYGEEKPLDPGHDEAAWAQNRRAQFVLK
jgi:peptidoglycan-associated lipoprotein